MSTPAPRTPDDPRWTDPRYVAAARWMSSNSNMPDWLKLPIPGRDITSIVDGILAAADAADPHRKQNTA